MAEVHGSCGQPAGAVRKTRPHGVPSLPEAFVSATRALLCVVAADGRILLANPALQRFTGRSAEELLGRRFWEVWVAPEHVLMARDALARAMATGRAATPEADWLAGDGRRRRIAMHNDVLHDAEGRPYAVASVGIDVTDQRQREARLHEWAAADRLTGIPHRGVLFETLRRHLDPASGSGCAVLFCDLDGFKAVNDLHGHAAGDRLLAAVAARLRSLLRPGELVARFGGDEFVFVCPAPDEERVTALVQQVQLSLAPSFDGPAGTISVGISVGAALGRPGEDADELIARADRAMYGAKSHHRRRRPRPE